MITRKDRQAFEAVAQMSLLRKSVVFIIPAVAMVGMLVQFDVAVEFARAAGMSFTQLIDLWLYGPDPAAGYTGIELAAAVRLERAFAFFCAGILMCTLPLRLLVDGGRYRRIALTLKALEHSLPERNTA